MNEKTQRVGPYQLFMLSLCAWAIVTLAIGTFWKLDPQTQTILDVADNAICGLFFVDFLGNLYRTPNRWAYFRSWGWIDLLSSIPTVDALRWGRAARLTRILRVLRGVRSARAIAHVLIERRAQSAFLATILLSLLLLVFASIAVLQFEADGGGTIQTAGDAMWWAVTTLSTVGYGDTYPITPEGRIVAACLMAAGVGVFGTLSGLVASWFQSSAVHGTGGEIDELKAMIAELQRRIPLREGKEI